MSVIAKELPSKIKNEESENAFKNDIIIHKYEDKNTILFARNYNIENNKLIKAYNIQNRGVDDFEQNLEISSIQRKIKQIFLFFIDNSIINSIIICELKQVYLIKLHKEKIIENIPKNLGSIFITLDIL